MIEAQSIIMIIDFLYFISATKVWSVGVIFYQCLYGKKVTFTFGFGE